MEIVANKLGKKFQNEWIFRNFSYHFKTGQVYAIIGPNGSGKSTLMQALSGYIPCNEGLINFSTSEKKMIDEAKMFQHIAFCSPFMELIEEFTLAESFKFHQKLKPLTIENENIFFEKIGLKNQEHKQVKHFSSGMKQKLKLGFCLFSKAEILFLDEPTTNLDIATKNWYQSVLKEITANKTIIIGSNDPFEYQITQNYIQISDFKHKSV